MRTQRKTERGLLFRPRSGAKGQRPKGGVGRGGLVLGTCQCRCRRYRWTHGHSRMPARILLGSRSSGFRLGERLTSSSSSWALGRARRNRSARSDHHILARFRGYEVGLGEPVRPEVGECSDGENTGHSPVCVASSAVGPNQTKHLPAVQPGGLGARRERLVCNLFPFPMRLTTSLVSRRLGPST
jgi:hypothetical protein